MIEQYIPEPETSQERYKGVEASEGREVFYRELMIGDKPAFEFRFDPELLESRNLTNLPDGYIVTGGAARSIAFEHLQGIELPVRDIDLAHVANSHSDKSRERRDKLAKQYAPEDFQHGNTIRTYGSLEQYFDQCDITLNEAAIDGNKVIITESAFFDMYGIEQAYDNNGNVMYEDDGLPAIHQLDGPIIRPTQYEQNVGSQERLASRATVFKAMLDTLLPEGRQAHIRDLDSGEGSSFLWAVAFKKAMEYGDDVAVRFTELYKNLMYSDVDGISIDYEHPENTIHALQEDMAGFLHEGMGTSLESIGILKTHYKRMQQ